MGRRGKTTTATLMEAMVSKPKIAIFSRMFIVSPLCLVSVPAFSPDGVDHANRPADLGRHP
jgi:hypothetical protein